MFLSLLQRMVISTCLLVIFHEHKTNRFTIFKKIKIDALIHYTSFCFAFPLEEKRFEIHLNKEVVFVFYYYISFVKYLWDFIPINTLFKLDSSE